MKRYLVILSSVLLVLMLAEGALAQPVQDKKFEFSISASMWNVKWEDFETETLINIPMRIGYFIYKGFEIEPEVFLTIPEDGDGTGILVLGNVSYNFKASERLIPFVLGGIGFGNSVQSFGIAWDTDESLTVYNFGAGIKFIVGDSAAIRIEYRFTKYTEKEDWVDRKDNNIFMGVSIFF